MSREPTFESFANFNFPEDEKTPALPIKNFPEFSKATISSGAFTTTVEIDAHHVAKISKMLRLSDGNPEIQSGDVPKFLVLRTEDKERDKKEVILRLRRFAEIKRQSYETLSEYVGEFLPKLYMFAIVDSPRREIERRMQKDASRSLINSVPVSETSLMEIWENVDMSNALDRKGYTQLEELYSNPEFQLELARFANSTLKLMSEKRLMLDICDRAGIRGKSNAWKKLEINRFDDIARLDDPSHEPILVFPRNTTFDKGKIRYYDIYPIDEIDRSVDDTAITNLRNTLRQNDWDSLKKLINSAEHPWYTLHVLRYLVLLRRMGAEI